MISPGAKVRVPWVFTKSLSAVAVPEDVVKLTVVMPPLAPLRVTMKLAIPACSVNVRSAMLKEGAASSSRLVTETLVVLS